MATPRPRTDPKSQPAFSSISPSPRLAERWLSDFAAEAWADADALTATFGRLPLDALQQVFARACACRDLKRIAASGLPLLRQGQLAKEHLLAAAWALCVQGRRAEAAEALSSSAPSRNPRFKNVQLRAGVLAAAGRLDQALDTVDQAIAAHPEFPLGPLRLTLERTAALAAREEHLTDWPGIAELVWGYLKLDLEPRAAKLLGWTMSKPAAELALATADQSQLVELALRAGLAGAALSYVETIPETRRRDDHWRAIETAAAALAGRGGAAATPRRPVQPAHAQSSSLRFWRAIESESRGDLESAIAGLCDLANDLKEDPNVRRNLSRCVGKFVAAEVRPSFQPGRTGRIVNVMPFFNELDLLRLHLEEMSPWVDRFVIVEGTRTFTGAEKPLVFEANRELFKAFEDKIVHVPIRTFPDHLTSAWGREFYQRDMAIAGASGLCGEDDYIIETDLDEIIDQRALDGFEADFAALELKLSRFFLNYRPSAGSPNRAGPKSTIFKAKHRARHGLSECRLCLSGLYDDAHLVRDAGWHFTSVFDAAGISLKVNSYSHREDSKPKFRTTDHFAAILGRLRAGELEPGWERAALDDSFPSYVLRNREFFADLIL